MLQNMPKAASTLEMDGVLGTKPVPKKKRRAKTSNANGHDCNICRKTNMTLSGLKIHLLTHSGEKPYLCTVCDKRFTCSSNLKKHQRIHNKDYIYACEVCGKTCSDPSNMKKHMTVHSGEKAYVCPSCGKSYSYAQSLRQHMDDIHVQNGEKRNKNKRKGHFPCPECGKVFGYYWRCSLHQARVHAIERPYKCPECGKSFARETILNKHLQTHEKPFACTECDRRFSFRDQLHKHNRTHSGEKPYQCMSCPKAFSQRGSLTEHMRTHTGIKPFACQICGMKFSSSSSLRRHERKVKSCFPAPQEEEIPIGRMYPRKAIYVPTPPVNIPWVETRPVIDTQEVQNSYISKSPCLGETPSNEVSEMSTDNALIHDNGAAWSTTESNNGQISKNLNVNGNLQATVVPSNQISMVVKCDKNGKISVIPVTLQIVNGTRQFTGINGKLDDSSENEPINTGLDACRETLSVPTNTHVTMPTSDSYSLNYKGTILSTNSTTNNIDSCSTMSCPTHTNDLSHQLHTMRHHPFSSSPTKQCNTSVNIQAMHTAVITNTAQATNQPITSPSQCHQITTSDHTPHYTTKTSSPQDIKPVLSENQHLSPTNEQPPSTSMVVNGEYTNYHASQNYTVTGRHPQFSRSTDMNNNMVNESVLAENNHFYGSACIDHLDIPSSSLITTNNNHQGCHKSSIIHSDPTKYNLPPVPISNGHYELSTPHILLPSSMTRRPSAIVEPKRTHSCFVKKEPEDVKPVIGIDVPAFGQ